MLTPRASSAGGAFTIECPASNVLCHRQGTVCETSGFRHRLARLRQPPALANSCFSQACIDPVDQNRAGAEWFKNSTAHDSERLPSYQRAPRVLSRKPMLPPGCPREASNTAYPFTRHLPRFFRVFSPRPPVKGCLGSCRARSRFSVRVFQRHTAATKDTSDRRLQSHISKMSTRASRGYRLATGVSPDACQ